MSRLFDISESRMACFLFLTFILYYIIYHHMGYHDFSEMKWDMAQKVENHYCRVLYCIIILCVLYLCIVFLLTLCFYFACCVLDY